MAERLLARPWLAAIAERDGEPPAVRMPPRVLALELLEQPRRLDRAPLRHLGALLTLRELHRVVGDRVLGDQLPPARPAEDLLDRLDRLAALVRRDAGPRIARGTRRASPR
jgi:hypothetical protein